MVLAVASAFVLAPLAARADVSVSQLAARHGLRLASLDPQAGVGLSGEGLRVVLRPGDPLVEINGRLETASTAPYVRKGQMFVSDAVARRIDALAAVSVAAPSRAVAQAERSSTPGAISLELRPVRGSETIAVSGTAPAGRAVQLTLYATFSRDIPDVVLSRQTVLPNGDGAFATTVPIAPAYFRGAIITVVASTPPSGPSASARITVAAPNVTVPPDNLPSDVK